MISYSRIPKDQTSDFMVNLWSLMASGAVHFTGNLLPSLASYTFSFSFWKQKKEDIFTFSTKIWWQPAGGKGATNASCLQAFPSQVPRQHLFCCEYFYRVHKFNIAKICTFLWAFAKWIKASTNPHSTNMQSSFVHFNYIEADWQLYPSTRMNAAPTGFSTMTYVQ